MEEHLLDIAVGRREGRLPGPFSWHPLRLQAAMVCPRRPTQEGQAAIRQSLPVSSASSTSTTSQDFHEMSGLAIPEDKGTKMSLLVPT